MICYIVQLLHSAGYKLFSFLVFLKDASNTAFLMLLYIIYISTNMHSYYIFNFRTNIKTINTSPSFQIRIYYISYIFSISILFTWTHIYNINNISYICYISSISISNHILNISIIHVIYDIVVVYFIFIISVIIVIFIIMFYLIIYFIFVIYLICIIYFILYIFLICL